MCGLGGYLGDPARPQPLRVAALTLRHRGPDDEGALGFAAADGTPGLLAFARLAIRDLSALGAQPMQSADGAYSLIYNGEIYNYAALREELVTGGAQLRSRSDTEVVLRAYAAHGSAAFGRLRGMFALALWDARRQELLLCRDVMGIKPLYYCCDGQRLVFASEVRALLAAGAVAPRLEPRAVHGFLSLGAVPEPLTIVRDVLALPPGHLLRISVSQGRLSAPTLQSILPAPHTPYFLLGQAASSEPAADRGRQPTTLAEKAHALGPLLRTTVAQHLAADVPVALLLSGGVDSTAVAVLARAAAPTAQLASFTLTYGDADPHSEGAAARSTAQALHLIHHDCHLTAESALLALPQFLAAQDQPSIDGFNTYLISQQVRAAGYKVALSGLGGDELFQGYELHRQFAAAWLLGDGLPGPVSGLGAVVERLLTSNAPPFDFDGIPGAVAGLGALGERLMSSSPSGNSGHRRSSLGTARARLAKAAAVLAAAALPPAQRAAALYTRLRALWSPAEVAALLTPDCGASTLEAYLPPSAELQRVLGLAESPLPEGAADRSLPGRIRLAYHVIMQLERQSYLRNTLLRDADALSMAHGVELRVPLCDAELWQRVTDLGPEPTRRPKQLLVAAADEPLVTAAAARHKRGFALPLSRFLPGALRNTVSACFADAELRQRAGLTTAASELWAGYLAAPTPRMTYRVWSLFTLLAYVKRHDLQL